MTSVAATPTRASIFNVFVALRVYAIVNAPEANSAAPHQGVMPTDLHRPSPHTMFGRCLRGRTPRIRTHVEPGEVQPEPDRHRCDVVEEPTHVGKHEIGSHERHDVAELGDDDGPAVGKGLRRRAARVPPRRRCRPPPAAPRRRASAPRSSRTPPRDRPTTPTPPATRRTSPDPSTASDRRTTRGGRALPPGATSRARPSLPRGSSPRARDPPRPRTARDPPRRARRARRPCRDAGPRADSRRPRPPSTRRSRTEAHRARRRPRGRPPRSGRCRAALGPSAGRSPHVLDGRSG